MTAHREPWERLADETPKAYAAFVAYRDLGLTRSLTKTARSLDKPAGYRTQLGEWSRRFSWVMRAASWDGEQERVHLAAMREARVKAAERNVSIANATFAVVAREIRDIANNPARTVSPAGLAQLMDSASKLEQLATGGATEHIRVGGSAAAGTSSDDDLEALTDEEIHARMLMLRRELDSEIADYDQILNPGDLDEDADAEDHADAEADR